MAAEGPPEAAVGAGGQRDAPRAQPELPAPKSLGYLDRFQIAVSTGYAKILERGGSKRSQADEAEGKEGPQRSPTKTALPSAKRKAAAAPAGGSSGKGPRGPRAKARARKELSPEELEQKEMEALRELKRRERAEQRAQEVRKAKEAAVREARARMQAERDERFRRREEEAAKAASAGPPEMPATAAPRVEDSLASLACASAGPEHGKARPRQRRASAGGGGTLEEKAPDAALSQGPRKRRARGSDALELAPEPVEQRGHASSSSSARPCAPGGRAAPQGLRAAATVEGPHGVGDAAAGDPADTAAQREKVKRKFREALEASLAENGDEEDELLRPPESLAADIEAALHKFFGPSKEYLCHARSIVFNLRDRTNPAFRQKLLSARFRPQDLPSMTTEDMASELKAAERARLRREATQAVAATATEHTPTDAFTCEKCLSTSCAYTQSQAVESCIRSGGEPSTTSVTHVVCLACSFRWTDRSGLG